jgi:hypothetical protein
LNETSSSCRLTESTGGSLWMITAFYLWPIHRLILSVGSVNPKNLSSVESNQTRVRRNLVFVECMSYPCLSARFGSFAEDPRRLRSVFHSLFHHLDSNINWPLRRPLCRFRLSFVSVILVRDSSYQVISAIAASGSYILCRPLWICDNWF